jgi:ribosomal protein S18 acetylase RimI-like enzyme
MITIRGIRWSEDVEVLSHLDTSFMTERIYRPVHDGLSFSLVEADVAPPLKKTYDFRPDDPAERANWDYAVIAEKEYGMAGFAAAQFVAWNRRVVLWHLYVIPSCRRAGVGTCLLAALDTYARSVQARCLWLETQNVNYPAIQFYRRSGFMWCGFDESLYAPEDLTGEETALFFARPVES